MNRLLNSLSALAAVIVASTTGFFTSLIFGPKITRARTCDVAFTYRMGAGFPGDVNRMHPASILPGLINPTNPPAAYGNPVLVDSATSSYRGVIAGDGSVTAGPIAGVIVRPFPTQQQSGGMSSAIGAAAPPTTGVADFLRQGFIMCKVPAADAAAVAKGGTVYVRAAATAGNNIQGALRSANDGTNNYIVTNARFTGPADSAGNCEIEVWAA